MTPPLTKEERESFRAYAEANRTESDGSECQWADYTLRLLADLERVEAANAEMFTSLEAQTTLALQMAGKWVQAEEERDEWADTARSEMAGRRMAEEEIARLRDIIAPGDAAAYEQGMAALEARLARVVEITKSLYIQDEISVDAHHALLAAAKVKP